MSNRERTGTRDLTYSRWHRPDSLHHYFVDRFGMTKFEAMRLADFCTVIDIDWCEYCKRCRQPLALIETQQGRAPKPADVTTKLAKRAGLPAYSLSYRIEDGEIIGFRVRQLHPEVGPIEDYTPGGWAEWLLGLHQSHTCE